MKKIVAFLIGVIIGVFGFNYFFPKPKTDLCGHKFTRTGLSVAFEYAKTHSFDFDFEASELYNQILKTEGVVSGWQHVGGYSFNIDVCPTCDRRKIIDRVEKKIRNYIQDEFCN